MTKRAKRLTEAVSNATSRRGFLKRISRLAGNAAIVLGGALAASDARAGKPVRKVRCCTYIRSNFATFTKCVRHDKQCPEWFQGAPLWYVGEAPHCRECVTLPG